MTRLLTSSQTSLVVWVTAAATSSGLVKSTRLTSTPLWAEHEKSKVEVEVIVSVSIQVQEQVQVQCSAVY